MNFFLLQYALLNKKSDEDVTRHWLDISKEKFDESLVDDIKKFLRVVILYIPLPAFWALFHQQVFIFHDYISIEYFSSSFTFYLIGIKVDFPSIQNEWTTCVLYHKT